MTPPDDALAPLARAPAADSPGARLERIRRAARLVASGRLNGPQSRHVAVEIERLAESLLRDAAPPAPVPDDACLSRLSAREREVLAALAEGHSVQEVAHRFCRSPKTINNQRTSVLRKLGLRNTAQLTRFAIRNGLVGA